MEDLWKDIHVYGNLAAFAFGCAVLMCRKGDALHVRLGYAFVICMALAQVYSFVMTIDSHTSPSDAGSITSYNWNFLHVLSALVLYWLYTGIHVVQEKHKHEDWMYKHVHYMGCAFISIIIAGFGVAGRKLEVCTSSGYHWAWFMCIGAAISVPCFIMYKRSLRLNKFD